MLETSITTQPDLDVSSGQEPMIQDGKQESLGAGSFNYISFISSIDISITKNKIYIYNSIKLLMVFIVM